MPAADASSVPLRRHRHLDSVSYDDDGDDADLAAETGRRLRALLREFSATTNRGGDNKQGGAGAGAYQTT